MRWRVPRFGIFFMVVVIVMGLGLLMMDDAEGAVQFVRVAVLA